MIVMVDESWSGCKDDYSAYLSERCGRVYILCNQEAVALPATQ